VDTTSTNAGEHQPDAALAAAVLSMPEPDSFRVLGVRVHAVQIPDVIAVVDFWIQERSASHYIAVTGMHGVTEAQHDATFREILNDPDCLVVPDGMPLVWLGRIHRKPLKRRVYGPELMVDFCTDSAKKGHRHFFYGGAPGVADRLAEILSSRCPGLNVVGTYWPPFRPLSEEEERQIEETIRSVAPDVVWVGLGTPKQEHWMYKFRPRLNVPVLVGIGAAFDFCTGRTRQAPRWMRERGLEWVYRLTHEPARLWRRYLIYGGEFVFMVLFELLGLRNSTR
jgi:N-acetylglucosaminyldiphosphoundecaprenol N-acetyl-beta-D-mannosaminyltransferase